MIVGLGTDIMEVSRMQRSLDRFGGQLRARIFTANEIAYCEARKRTSAESYAARFAAKEAAAKALGTGIARGVSWQDIEVRRSPGQAPIIHFTGRALDRANALRVAHASLSLTHARDMALAVVVLES